MGSWAEVVLPVQTADARPNPATSRRRTTLRAPEMRGLRPTTGASLRARCAGRPDVVVGLVRPFLHPHSAVNRCHDQAGQFHDRIATLASAIHLGTLLNFGEDVPTTRFSKNRYTRDNFRRLNRRVSGSLSRKETPSSSAFASSTFSLSPSFSNFFVSRRTIVGEKLDSPKRLLYNTNARARLAA